MSESGCHLPCALTTSTTLGEKNCHLRGSHFRGTQRVTWLKARLFPFKDEDTGFGEINCSPGVSQGEGGADAISVCLTLKASFSSGCRVMASFMSWAPPVPPTPLRGQGPQSLTVLSAFFCKSYLNAPPQWQRHPLSLFFSSVSVRKAFRSNNRLPGQHCLKEIRKF